ncbi:beta-glycosidase [Mucilaginibacter pallidiroseus]|uniref:Beta-glycosidase n=1 Tax=Mucilaginibacter pallidiroseus TaxID=2599295 RepID=A0A563U2Y1_9SPHI|nr:glycoside hydrolase [Mucilaginibacter pallidiroseus]TWR25697.1 beta-glycosidase [Mucilaginibacter pallidiroseus]
MHKFHYLPIFLLLLSGNAIAQTPSAPVLTITINARDTAQRIDNIGASGCWFSEGIGKYWPVAKREKIAELLFSKKMDARGNPLGIGLSAWRFNIGGGTAEHGDSSGIKDFRRRAESFIAADGTYDWNKQAGYQWFLRKARQFGVENLIAFSNTPPVHFTSNGYGYKTVKSPASNLRPDKYAAYADFLATVAQHFDKEGLHFKYISPVNEPQWEWYGKPGQMDQEGSPWTNQEIQKITMELDKALTAKKLTSKILTTEAGMLNYLYEGKSAAGSQIQELFNPAGRYTITGLKHVPPIVAGHSYFTDANDSTMVVTRKRLADTAAKYKTAYWESEYSMLGDGFREGTKQSRIAIDCALFLAKVINRDLTIGNAAAWQLWNAYEPGKEDVDTRYYLIALKPNEAYTDGDFTATKNLWAMGNYSRFIRPGMQRIKTGRSDGLSDIQAGQDVMVSAFKGKDGVVVIVLINYTTTGRQIQLKPENFKLPRKIRSYTTSAQDNLAAALVNKWEEPFTLKPRSITTLVFKN